MTSPNITCKCALHRNRIAAMLQYIEKHSSQAPMQRQVCGLLQYNCCTSSRTYVYTYLVPGPCFLFCKNVYRKPKKKPYAHTICYGVELTGFPTHSIPSRPNQPITRVFPRTASKSAESTFTSQSIQALATPWRSGSG